VKKIEISREDLPEKMENKYAAVVVIANRAKEIRENPGDVEDSERKLKPTVVASREFRDSKLKYPEFDITIINQEE